VVSVVYLEPGTQWRTAMRSINRVMTALNGGKSAMGDWSADAAPGGERLTDVEAIHAAQKLFFEAGLTGARFQIAPDGAIFQLKRG
jgi:hypothetical protein